MSHNSQMPPHSPNSTLFFHILLSNVLALSMLNFIAFLFVKMLNSITSTPHKKIIGLVNYPKPKQEVEKKTNID